MAEKSTIARPYAKAAFGLAFDQHSLAAWSDALAVAGQVAADERVRKLLVSPHLTTADLAELFIAIMEPTVRQHAGIDEQAGNFIRTLATNRRLGLLPEIRGIFEKLKSESENTADVTLTSAVPLDEELQRKYSSALRNRLRREVRLHTAIDPSLIGGAVLRAGDLVIDGSLRGRLERLNAEIGG